MNSISESLSNMQTVVLHQQRELLELVGFESTNKFSIETENGDKIGFAAEQGKGFMGAIFRQILGHWRSFEISIFNKEQALELKVVHPFRWFFSRLELSAADGRHLGAIQLRFSIISKKFDVLGAQNQLLFKVRAPIWRIWTFDFLRNDETVAVVKKKWGGILREGFLDADRFVLEFSSPSIQADERLLLLASALFIDLRYFENKAQSGGITNLLSTD